MLSFGSAFSSFIPRPFPIPNDRLIAPFWSDIFVLESGNIYYRFSSDENLIEEVGYFIKKYFGEDFTPALLFIATWDRVPPFGGPPDLVSVVFLVIICQSLLSPPLAKILMRHF